MNSVFCIVITVKLLLPHPVCLITGNVYLVCHVPTLERYFSFVLGKYLGEKHFETMQILFFLELSSRNFSIHNRLLP